MKEQRKEKHNHEYYRKQNIIRMDIKKLYDEEECEDSEEEFFNGTSNPEDYFKGLRKK